MQSSNTQVKEVNIMINDILANGVPVKSRIQERPLTKFEQLVQEPAPRIRGRLVRNGKSINFVPATLADALLLKPSLLY